MSSTQASIIGIMLLFPEAIGEAAESARPDWFTGLHRKAFEYLVANNGADPVSLSNACGLSLDTITSWTDAEFTSSFLSQHLVNLKAEVTARKIAHLKRQIAKHENLDAIQSEIDRVSASLYDQNKASTCHIAEAVESLSAMMIDRSQRSGLLGMSTGLSELDLYTEGLHKGDLVVIAGPSSMGKTALVQGIVESVLSAGCRAMVFSLEMTKEQLLMRSTSAMSGVPLSLIRNGKLDAAQEMKVNASFAAMRAWNLVLSDPAGITVSELCRKVKIEARRGLDLVAIDYLQIMTYDRDREVKELDEITVTLKNLAKELNIVVLLLSQLNRGNEKENRKPRMTDLRGSGAIENHADVILFPWREAANCLKCQTRDDSGGHDTESHQRLAEIIIGKQRQGERNVAVQVDWIGQLTRFVNRGMVSTASIPQPRPIRSRSQEMAANDLPDFDF